PFGSKCYVHIPKEKRPSANKLSPRADIGILIGFHPDTNTIYKVWIPTKHQFFDSREVTFPPPDMISEGVNNLPPSPTQPSITSSEITFVPLPALPVAPPIAPAPPVSVPSTPAPASLVIQQTTPPTRPAEPLSPNSLPPRQESLRIPVRSDMRHHLLDLPASYYDNGGQVPQQL